LPVTKSIDQHIDGAAYERRWQTLPPSDPVALFRPRLQTPSRREADTAAKLRFSQKAATGLQMVHDSERL
jgi:hypothetical protein